MTIDKTIDSSDAGGGSVDPATAQYEKRMNDFEPTSMADQKMLFKAIQEINAIGLDEIKQKILKDGGVFPIRATSGMLRVGYHRERGELFIIGFDNPEGEKMAKIIGDAVGIKSLRGRIIKRGPTR